MKRPTRAVNKRENSTSMSLFEETPSPWLILSDIILSFQSWLLLTELLRLVWFWPLVKMDVTGMEWALLGYVLGGAMLGRAKYRLWLTRRVPLVRATAGVLSLASVFAMHDDVGLAMRTLTLAVAFAVDWSAIVLTWFRGGVRSRVAVEAHLIALLLVHLMRVHWLSFVPMWTITLYNLNWICAVAFAGACGQHFLANEHAWTIERRLERASWAKTWLASALCAGGTISLLHLFASEHGVVPRYADAPVESGLLVTVALVVGIGIGFEHRSVVRSAAWFALGSAALCTFWLVSPSTPWLSVLSGATVVLFAAALLPSAVHDLQATRWIGRAAFVVMLVVLVNMLVSIWTVAYKFCPGGWLLRERHYVMLVISWASIAAQFWFVWRHPPAMHERPSNTNLTRVLVLIVLLFGAPVVLLRLFRATLAVPPIVRRPGEPFNIAFWTVHFGYDNNGHANLFGLRDWLHQVNAADVVALLETDVSRPFFGNVDIVEFLSTELHMHSDFGPPTSTNTFGCALLSRFPIIRAEHVVLPSPEGELACMIVADLDLGDAAAPPLRVVVSHFGNTEDVEDRRLQTLALAELARKQPRDAGLLVLAYLTTFPTGPNFKVLLDAGLVDPLAIGWDVSDPHYPAKERYWEYLLTNRAVHLSNQREFSSGLSDTSLQTATVSVVGRAMESPDDEVDEEPQGGFETKRR